MKLLPPEEKITLYETGFDNNTLDRVKFADQLSGLINKTTVPFVIALDGKWGTGKSYFLKRWVKHHSKEATTVYFDAFESDYLSEPLISITSAVSDRIPEEASEKWKQHAYNIGKPALGILANLATLGAKELVGELTGAVIDVVKEPLINASDKFWAAEDARKNSMTEFKNTLSKLANDKPLIIVVDELDRCRPDYALSVLEVVKHFFSVPNVHFILGVNLIALENSVKARYGAGIDANNYLKKFINIKTSLPEKIGTRGVVNIIEKYFGDLSSNMELNEDFIEKCKDVILVAQSRNDISLRDIQKICTKIALTPKPSSERRHYTYSYAASILIVASVIDEKFHRNLIDKRVDAKQILEFLGMKESDTFINENGKSTSEFNHTTEIMYAILCHCCFGYGCEELNICAKHFHDLTEGSFYDKIDHKWMLEIQRKFVDVFKAI